jgi:uncharacterized protein (TIRG00374 family)
MKINGKLWVSIIISLVFTILIFYKVDLNKTKEAFSSANYMYIPLAVVLTLVTNILRTYRWKYILKPIKKISTHSLFSGVAIGYMANNLLPARLGEFVRAYIIGRKEEISKSSTLATILLERIFDGLALLFFLGIISLLFPLPLWVKQAGIAAAAFFLVLSAFLFLCILKKHKAMHLVESLAGIFSSKLAKQADRLLNQFLTGLVVVNLKKNVHIIFIFSIIVWLVESTTYYIISLSFGIILPIYVSLLVVVIVNIGILIPSAPGYVGAFEFFCISSLALFSVEQSVALSFSIVLHVVLFLPITAIGIFYFLKENVNFAEVRNIEKVSPKSV